MAEARFLVGIDLGTTHSVVAYAEVRGGPVRELAIDQLVEMGRSDRRALLPSFLYAPLDEEIASVSAHPMTSLPFIAGELARKRGAELPGRLVSSAKSWLCHPGVDRTAAILPWGEAEEGERASPKISPVDASARYLAHLRAAWDLDFPDAPLTDQEVVLTVPASFDEVARELTVDAMRRAGISARLLEEPTAAFYAWLAAAGTDALESLLEGDRDVSHVLVCDVGGGTTDLSLLAVRRGDRGPRVDRVSVGDHLLLGGDNMDLALAHVLEQRMGAPQLSPRQHAQLVSASRAAKELLLGPNAPVETPVTVLGSGSRLLGAARSTRVLRDEVERIVLDGFLPRALRDDAPARARGGLVALGLPFARDAAITKHIAAFLARSGASADALLLNGGVFHSERARARLSEVLDSWRDSPVRVLPHADPDRAVARGAVAYGLARRGRGTRVGGGSAHAFFVGVDGGGPARAMCVVPRGAEPGERHRAPLRLLLAVGRPARFALFASRGQDAHSPGDVVDVDDELLALPPLATTIASSDRGDVPVAVEGELTEVGTLDLACVELPDSQETSARRFRLAFQLRGEAAPPSMRPSARPRSPGKIDEATTLLGKVFGKPKEAASAREIKDLVRDLERVLGERSTWSADTARGIFDALIPEARARRRSADHERQFWSLAGFTLRPGFGAPGDETRVGALAPLFREGIFAGKEPRVWQQALIAWRRVAGGLDEPTSVEIRDTLDESLRTSAPMSKRGKSLPLEAHFDALALASFLERVPASRKTELTSWIVERTYTSQDARLWESIGRLGARVPAYASAHFVIGGRAAEALLDDLFREKWNLVPSAPLAAWRLARRTDDRARDVGERARKEAAKRLSAAGHPGWAAGVLDVVAVEEKERAEQFGDSLPVGLRLG